MDGTTINLWLHTEVTRQHNSLLQRLLVTWTLYRLGAPSLLLLADVILKHGNRRNEDFLCALDFSTIMAEMKHGNRRSDVPRTSVPWMSVSSMVRSEGFFLPMCVCVCVCVCVCLSVCVYVHVQMTYWSNACVYDCAYTCVVHACLCAYKYDTVSLCVCIYATAGDSKMVKMLTKVFWITFFYNKTRGMLTTNILITTRQKSCSPQSRDQFPSHHPLKPVWSPWHWYQLPPSTWLPVSISTTLLQSISITL